MTTISQYISVSRRTDIPRFFHREFLAAWEEGEITYEGGYGRSYTVSLRPEAVLGYIFWSKDFAPLLGDPRFPALLAGNNALCHFTINYCPPLEPHLAPLAERLQTLGKLCALLGPERVLWRFDPLCKFSFPGGPCQSNGEAFFRLLPIIRATGVRRCYFSFMTPYAKTRGRGVQFFPFAESEKIRLGQRMAEAAGAAGMTLHNCCNPELLALVPEIEMAHCVDDRLLAQTDRFHCHRPRRPRPTRSGCGCSESRDIGSYRQPCPHGCRYCYANPARE